MNAKFLNKLACLVILLFASEVRAEGGCPPGQYPQSGQGWRTCVPMPEAPQEAQAQQRRRWADQYQAIATDGALGILGTAVDQTTNDGAVEAALGDCRAKGGRQCKLEVAVVNGCVAMVLGVTTRVIDYGKTKADAEDAATKQCSKHNSKCEVYYSACSLPIGI